MSYEYKTVNVMSRPVRDEERHLHPQQPYSQGYTQSYNSSDKELPPAPSPKESLLRGFRHHLRLALWGIAMSTASVTTGYEQIFTSAVTSLPAFNQRWGQMDPTTANNPIPTYTASATWIALWAVSHPLGASAGSMLGGWTLDKIGRRYTLGIATAWLTITPFISFFSDELSTVAARAGLYFFGKLLQGVGVGALITVLMAYTSEVLPPSIKGSILALHVPATLLGNTIGALAIQRSVSKTGTVAYRLPMAGQWFTLIIPVLLLIFLPESPVWSIRQNRIQEARAGCGKLQGPLKDPIDDMFPRLVELIAEQEQKQAQDKEVKWSELFKTKSDLRRTLIIIFTAAAPIFLGLPFITHAAYVGEVMGMSDTLATKLYLAGSLLALIGSFLSFVIIPAVGRRPNLLFSSIAITVLWLSGGIAGSFLHKAGPAVNGVLTKNDDSVTKYIAASMIILTFLLAVFAWPVTVSISGETSSLRLRAKSLAVRGLSENVFSVIISVMLPYLYTKEYANIANRMGFIFFGFSIIVVAIAWLHIPETQGLDSTEIDALYESKNR